MVEAIYPILKDSFPFLAHYTAWINEYNVHSLAIETFDKISVASTRTQGRGETGTVSVSYTSVGILTITTIVIA